MYGNGTKKFMFWESQFPQIVFFCVCVKGLKKLIFVFVGSREEELFWILRYSDGNELFYILPMKTHFIYLIPTSSNVLLTSGGESAWGGAFKDEFKPNLIHQGKSPTDRLSHCQDSVIQSWQ